MSSGNLLTPRKLLPAQLTLTLRRKGGKKASIHSSN